MKTWWTPAEIVARALPSLPGTVRGVNGLADRQGWAARVNAAGEPLARKRQGRGGGWEYHYALFPAPAQAALVKEIDGTAAKPAPARDAAEVWAFFERLPESRKAKARQRLALLERVEALHVGGLPKDQAVHMTAVAAGVGLSTVYGWFDLVAGVERADWLPYLAPRHAGRVATVECDPRAWDALKTDWLRDSRPSFQSCYERLRQIAAAQGWTIPAARTLERRLAAEIPKPVQVLCRQGAEALARMYPHQERDRTVFHALEAVNADGHKWDVFVRWPDGTIGRPISVAVQDLYSNKFLACRTDRTENADLVRLAFADVFKVYGIPDLAWLDNGRGFAAKYITGGTTTRFRFKVKAEDPTGILTNLGVQVHWTRPYHGQSKPIERAFRDFCDAIAKHPRFEGAYTGNKPDAKPESYGSKAVPIETFLQVVEQGIRAHNARPGRNTRVCRRTLSFDQAFKESYARALIRRAGDEQLRMCLLAAESVRSDQRSGSVTLLGNRYWAECLHDHIGKPLTVRFDPDALQDGVHVYRLDGAYVGFADCIEAAGFNDTEAAREHGRNLKAFRRATKEAAAAERRLSIDELVALLPDVEDAPAPETKTVRLVTGNLAVKPISEIRLDRENADVAFFDALGAGLRLVRDRE